MATHEWAQPHALHLSGPGATHRSGLRQCHAVDCDHNWRLAPLPHCFLQLPQRQRLARARHPADVNAARAAGLQALLAEGSHQAALVVAAQGDTSRGGAPRRGQHVLAEAGAGGPARFSDAQATQRNACTHLGEGHSGGVQQAPGWLRRCVVDSHSVVCRPRKRSQCLVRCICLHGERKSLATATPSAAGAPRCLARDDAHGGRGGSGSIRGLLRASSWTSRRAARTQDPRVCRGCAARCRRRRLRC